jgi:hypothetical protein
MRVLSCAHSLVSLQVEGAAGDFSDHGMDETAFSGAPAPAPAPAPALALAYAKGKARGPISGATSSATVKQESGLATPSPKAGGRIKASSLGLSPLGSPGQHHLSQLADQANKLVEQKNQEMELNKERNKREAELHAAQLKQLNQQSQLASKCNLDWDEILDDLQMTQKVENPAPKNWYRLASCPCCEVPIVQHSKGDYTKTSAKVQQ